MKSTIVPAQITTVEDKIAGNLSFTQMMLLVAPVIVTGLLFILLPPFVHVTTIKLAIGSCLFLTSAALAIRIKGELLLHRIVARISYNIRPKYYVYDKNDTYLRYELTTQTVAEEFAVTVSDDIDIDVRIVDTPQRARLESAITDPRSRFQMLVRKGGLHVHISEVKEESF